MLAFTYTAHLEDGGVDGLLVRFPDIPEALTQGGSLEEATSQAEDALAVALEGYLERGRPFPKSTQPPPPGSAIAVVIPVRPIVAARWLLVEATRARGLSQVGLAKLIGRDEKSVRRMLTGHNASLSLMLAVLRTLGVRVGLAV
jgi:antitoxin HicB